MASSSYGRGEPNFQPSPVSVHMPVMRSPRVPPREGRYTPIYICVPVDICVPVEVRTCTGGRFNRGRVVPRRRSSEGWQMAFSDLSIPWAERSFGFRHGR